MKSYIQKTLSDEIITDYEIFEARTDYELERRRRDPEYTGLHPLDLLGVNTQ